jgi:hypothetical protein
LSLTNNLDRPILEISGFRYVDPGTAPGLNCLAMIVGETRYNLSAKYQPFSWRRQSKEISLY